MIQNTTAAHYARKTVLFEVQLDVCVAINKFMVQHAKDLMYHGPDWAERLAGLVFPNSPNIDRQNEG